MLFPPKPRPRYDIRPPLISLVDIVLLLLIYFLLTSNYLANDGIEVDLPRAETAQTREQQDLVIHLDQAGNLYLGDDPVGLDALGRKLTALLQDDPERLVVVRADQGAALGRAARTRIGEQFTAEREGQAWEEVFRKVLSF